MQSLEVHLLGGGHRVCVCVSGCVCGGERGEQKSYLHSNRLLQNSCSPHTVGGVGREEGDKGNGGSRLGGALSRQLVLGCLTGKGEHPRGEGGKEPATLPGGHQRGSQEGPLQINDK